MKHLCLIIYLLIPLATSAQERGVSPLPAEAPARAGTTRAVVIGISDYQDETIPDLKNPRE